MKKNIALLVLILVPAFYLMPNMALAQETESIMNNPVTNGGFGAPVVKFTSINNDFGLLVGGRGGWVVNFHADHAFVIGGGGYGLLTDVEIDAPIFSGEPVYLSFGYGGLEMEYVNRSRNLVHFSVYSLIGAGVADYRDNNIESMDGNELFVMEPGISLLFNVTDFFRMGGGVSYRYVTGVNMDGVSNSDLSGASAVLTFKFGRF